MYIVHGVDVNAFAVLFQYVLDTFRLVMRRATRLEARLAVLRRVERIESVSGSVSGSASLRLAWLGGLRRRQSERAELGEEGLQTRHRAHDDGGEVLDDRPVNVVAVAPWGRERC